MMRTSLLPAGAVSTGLPALLLIAALFGLNAASFMNAALVTDSGRDIANAWAIAQGSSLPLTGPEIYGTWRLGPIWFYLLAVPFLAGGSLTALALWVGLLASLKIPLAYLVAKRLCGPAAGIALASLVALPGWNSAGALVISHTAVVETAVFAVLWVGLWIHQRPDPGRFTLAGLMLALAMHAHPTALVVAPWLLAAAWSRIPGARLPLLMSAAGAGFLLPWLPMLYEEALSGWPQIRASQAYVASVGLGERIQSIPVVARGLLAGWVPLLADYLLPSWPGAKALLLIGWSLALVGAAAGAAKALWLKRWAAPLLLLQLVGALLLVGVLRLGPPVYMLFAVFPLASLAFLAGWRELLPERVFGRFAHLLLAASVLVLAAVVLHRSTLLEQGTLALPAAAFADVRAPIGEDVPGRFWLAVSQQEAAAATLCGEGVAVHGEFASVLALGAGVAAERACGASRGPRLGGREGAWHLVGLPVAHADALGVAGTVSTKGWLLTRADPVLHPPSGLEMRVNIRYLVDEYRDRLQLPPAEPIELSVRCLPNALLVANNLDLGLNTLMVDVVLDGASVAPALTSISASYFDCGAGGEARVRMASLNQDAADLFMIRRDGAAGIKAGP